MFAEQGSRNQKYNNPQEEIQVDARLAALNRRVSTRASQSNHAKDHTMTQAIQVLSLGSDTHERKIRQTAGLASLPMFTALKEPRQNKLDVWPEGGLTLPHGRGSVKCACRAARVSKRFWSECTRILPCSCCLGLR